MTTFVESRINDGLVIYETIGGPVFLTEIVELNSGAESRNQRWSIGLGEWEIGDRVVTQAELAEIMKFHRAVKGSAIGFRFKDWGDFEVAQAEGVLIGTAGGPTHQLHRRYVLGAISEDRMIRKPVAGTVTVYRGGSPVAFGAGAGQIALDTATGIVTWVPDLTRNINAITNANPGKIQTTTSHTLTNGQQVYLSGINGMTQLNGQVVTVTVVDADEFTIGVNTTSYGVYTTAGTVAKYPQGSETLAWAGEFDVPVRFASDRLRHRFQAKEGSTRLFYLDTLPVKELRKP